MKKQEIEIWKDIPGYEGYYQCSIFGRVKSLDRVIIRKDGRVMKHKGKILSQNVGTTDYLILRLYKNDNGKTFKVHQLIAMTFLGHKPDGYKIVIDHIDNNKLNNHVDNLQLTSNRKNSSKDRSGYTSKYIGVCFDKYNNKWMVNIYISGKNITLSRFNFEDEHLAGKLYQLALEHQDKLTEDTKKGRTEFRTYLKSLL